MKLSNTISFLTLSFVLAAAFIALFFFLYVSKIETNMISSQVSAIINKFSVSVRLLSSEQDKQNIKAMIDEIKLPDFSTQDNTVIKNNTNLFNKTIKIFLILIITGLIIVGIIHYKYNTDLLKVIIHSSIIMLVISGTYYSFITFISQNYILADENVVIYSILKTVKQYIDRPLIPVYISLPDSYISPSL